MTIRRTPVVLPDRALRQWALQGWARTKRLNATAGTGGAILQMDYIPGLCSAAYFSLGLKIQADTQDERVQRLLQTGEAIQRFWLTATKLGLAVQPCLATLAFAHYGRTGAEFTTQPAQRRAAVKLASSVDKILSGEDETVFLGRIGWPRPRQSLCRSVRRPFEELLDEN